MTKHRILLVEDEKVVAADIEECVKALGYEVVGTAATGAEALRLTVSAKPDLVLMDIKLKGALDGIDVAQALYHDFKIPVVYLTAHADKEILERAKKTAPAGYVLKPFDERTLRTEIEIAYDRHRRERTLIDSGERLATAISSIDQALIVTRENGQVAVMNRLAETMTGWKQDEALGKPIADILTIVNGETGMLRATPTGRVMREGISIGLGEQAVLMGRHGRTTPIQGSATPVWDGEQSPVGVCLLFRAANVRAADENWGAAEHSRSSRLEILGRLTGGVAQRLTRLLEESKGSERAAELANRLLAFRHLQPAAPANLDLNQLIADLEDLLRCALGDQMELVITLRPDTGIVKADAAQIELLLMNLAVAAAETPGGRQLRIETAAMQGEFSEEWYAVVTVSEQGAERNAVADLPTLDEIVRDAEGEIRVVSENGAVKIYLPKVV